MTSRKPRGLRPEEEELWQRVRKSASPLHPEVRTNRTNCNKEKYNPAEPPRWNIPKFRIGEKAGQETAGARPVGSAALVPRMDARKFHRMKKGKFAPEAKLDLHGHTIAQAHPALVSFIQNAHAQGLRLVLVITGKGRSRPSDGPIPVRTGALRHQVPQWLHSAPLNSAVLQVSEAHARHGGAGALYVYLKRRR